MKRLLILLASTLFGFSAFGGQLSPVKKIICSSGAGHPPRTLLITQHSDQHLASVYDKTTGQVENHLVLDMIFQDYESEVIQGMVYSLISVDKKSTFTFTIPGMKYPNSGTYKGLGYLNLDSRIPSWGFEPPCACQITL